MIVAGIGCSLANVVRSRVYAHSRCIATAKSTNVKLLQLGLGNGLLHALETPMGGVANRLKRRVSPSVTHARVRTKPRLHPRCLR